ncbi:MAG: hypothetical protein ACOYO1_01405 [Bacteroidales bacterium]
MNFRASFCDPFQKDVIELGEIEKDKILELFEHTDWDKYIAKIKENPSSAIHYSPSLEIENKDNRNGICISAIDETEYYIFFKRPKMRNYLFGLYKHMNPDYLTEIRDQTDEDVKVCLIALMNNDLDFLENKIK